MTASDRSSAPAKAQRSRSLWITWHDHQRTRSLVDELGIPLFVRDRSTPLNRHVGGFVWACRTLTRENPGLVLLHHSYALLLACVLHKAVRPRGHVRIVADCHNKALKRRVTGPLAPIFLQFKRSLFRRVDLLVVTNEQLRPVASAYGPPVAVLRDPLPKWGTRRPPTAQSGAPYVMFVCSFDQDEPTAAIFAAALRIVRQLAMDVVITGDVRKIRVPVEVAREPRIRLPGFMPRARYQDCLQQAAVVVVLTGDDDCLMCGAYEGVGAARPLVVSDTMALREVFGDNAVYTQNDAAAILAAVTKARTQPEQERRAARERFLVDFARERDVFAEQLHSYERPVNTYASGTRGRPGRT